ncbi:Glycerophosphoryl diester phosphodiesterase [Macleaya cordata]|uniref:glycerophosphodiester phosphodiesterase n=1 Tax=Macleaya cordata TaxID=56857 RepID=A0A200PSY3_MACCD|nr:Glycerophosphoryl diester phosphodiesterase [Macleaya cordata]
MFAGESPVVIARGGLSGLFPDSSSYAYEVAKSSSLNNLIVFCDLQLTKDGVGICQTEIRLDNCTNIAGVYPKGQKTYNINGENVRGWFAVDFMSKQLFDGVALSQNILSRPSLYDDMLPFLALEDVTGLRAPQIWLNVQYDMFYKQRNVNVRSYIQKAIRTNPINYISSPEIDFLKSLSGVVNKDRTKLIFRFLAADAIEPTTKQKYGSILENLSLIKSFASGILVPKNYIWPVNADNYLEAHTSLVADAHSQGLEVYASGFANDMPGSFNYSYDPTAEYLQFIDNSEFAVDGFLTDFPPTASEAIGELLLFLKELFFVRKAYFQGKTLVISHNGASGVFAPCTDLAYQQAVDDGADIIDCSVQMTKDGLAFCADSADLAGSTTAMTTFMTKATTVPEIQPKNGIFSFDLTWSEIQSLKPQLTSQTGENGLPRNPANRNKGKLILLSEFLDFAKAKAVSGVMITIKNAAFLASKKGFSLPDVVSSALANATLDKQSTQQVLIQSDDTSVLSKFKNVPTFKKVLIIDEIIGEVPQQSLDEIKKFAVDAVNVRRPSLVKTLASFTSVFTDVVDKMHSANISVYVSTLMNEYTAIAFDLYSDPISEISLYVTGFEVEGLITDNPSTASAFMRSPCANPTDNAPYAIIAPQPSEMLNLAAAEAVPPAEPPAPVLKPADVVDPPLPPVANADAVKNPTAAGPAGTPGKSSQPANVANFGLCLVSIITVMVLNFLY